MDRKPSEPKRTGKEKAANDEDEEELQEEEKKRRSSSSSAAMGPTSSVTVARRGGGAGSQPACQAEKCGVDLSEAKRYHRRHKVCEAHAKAAVVMVAGLRQRFCQQCSRFCFSDGVIN